MGQSSFSYTNTARMRQARAENLVRGSASTRAIQRSSNQAAALRQVNRETYTGRRRRTTR